ncbi:MAG: lytic murein transglycosylase B [Nevskia sp.]
MRSLLAAAVLGLFAANVAADYTGHPKVALLIDTLRDNYGFSEPELDTVRADLKDAQKLSKLIERELNNKEKAAEVQRLPNWDDYAPIHVNARNIANGLRFLDDHAVWFAKAEAQYGVPPTVIAGILGVETKYGTYTGKFRVLDALATQGFDHPTRSPFFFSELTSFFVFCRDAGRAAAEYLGSYAGAMGSAQFMPSNYRRLAVDYDGDGRRDLWSPPDAIGSIGNYLVQYDRNRAFRRGEPLIVAVTLTRPLSPDFPRNGKAATQTVAELRAAGIEPATALPDSTPAGLVELRRGNASEFWIALPNFYSIQTYNPRIFYAMAVTQLANALAAAQAAQVAARNE